MDRSSGVALWRQVRDDLKARLDVGEFADAFPGELALCDCYGVSRHTVREALRSLREQGVVTASRGQLSRIAEPKRICQPVGVLYSIFESLEAQGISQASIVRRLDERRDAHAAIRLGLEESTPLVYLERLRLADNTPLALDRAWMPASIASSLLNVDFTHTGLYDELDRRCGTRVTGGREEIFAQVPTPAQAQLLDLGPNSAVFRIDRLGYVRSSPVETRVTVLRGDRFSLDMTLSDRPGYQTRFAH